MNVFVGIVGFYVCEWHVFACLTFLRVRFYLWRLCEQYTTRCMFQRRVGGQTRSLCTCTWSLRGHGWCMRGNGWFVFYFFSLSLPLSLLFSSHLFSSPLFPSLLFSSLLFSSLFYSTLLYSYLLLSARLVSALIFSCLLLYSVLFSCLFISSLLFCSRLTNNDNAGRSIAARIGK